MRALGLACILGLLLATPTRAVEVVTEGGGTCEEYRLNRELPVYKDPTIFLSRLKEEYGDKLGWSGIFSESPLLTTVKGRVNLMRLGPDQPYKSFGFLSKLYGLSDPRLKVSPEAVKNRKGKQLSLIGETAPLIVPVMFCGPSEAYTDTLGFVLKKDLEDAQKARAEAKGSSLPPSTYPNPIPHWKSTKGG